MTEDRGSGRWDADLYEATATVLTAEGVPPALAQQAAEVIARDDSNQPNLGRTPEQQHVVTSAWYWYWAKQEEGV